MLHVMKTNSSVEMETVSEVLTNVIMIMTVKTTQTKKDVLVRKFFWVSKNDQTEHFVRGENNILMSHTAQRHAHALLLCSLAMGSTIGLFLLATGKTHSYRNG